MQGIPYPTVKFKKDWRQVAGSHRVKVAREDFDHWSLNIQNAIRTDEGVYECVAENVAGKVYCTANAKITGNATNFHIYFLANLTKIRTGFCYYMYTAIDVNICPNLIYVQFMLYIS